MNAQVLPFPGSPNRQRARLALPPTTVEWDPIAGVWDAVCARCLDGISTPRLDEAHEWAEEHHCDPELAALLASITGNAA
jgi:hypothetical protein